MKQRKQVLIDKDFQIKKSLKIMGLVSAIITIMVITGGTFVAINNSKIRDNNITIEKNTKLIKKNIEVQRDNLILYSLAKGKKTGRDKSYSSNLTKDYNKSIDILNNAIASNEKMVKINKEIERMNTWLVIAIIIITIAGMAFLFSQLIRQTHRISGPIYLMTIYINDILKGGTPQLRNLRDNDDLRDFYEDFKNLAEHTIELREAGRKSVKKKTQKKKAPVKKTVKKKK